ncbi:MAG: alpha/beta hydrolase family protein [Candidatus Odinarchaeota archaeon]
MSKKLLAPAVIFCIGLTLMAVGAFSPNENVPIRVSFNTFTQYTDELNSFFNRTAATPLEDATNKLIEDYRVAGYVILPQKEKPPDGYPVIIWMHGFGVSSDMQMNYPRQFARAGFFTVAIDQPGHGWSGGYWDMGIQTLLGVYSTIEWLVNESDYRNVIDTSRIGVSGHSMGGIATARTGIFDSWINPSSGKKVGTGIIRSSCSVFSWDDLKTMVENLVERYTGIENVWEQPAIINLLESWRWLTNHDPSILEKELAIRSVSNYINFTNIKNFCLIIGGNDELVTVESQSFIMANATTNTTGIPMVPWEVINDTVHITANHTWSFGSQSDGTARRLVMVPGKGHIGEAISWDVVQNITYWFAEAMDCDSVDPDVPRNFQVPFLVKRSGWILTLFGSACATLPSLSYIATSRIGLNTVQGERAAFLEDKEKKRYFTMYVAVTVILISLSGVFKLKSVTHFWPFDLVIPGVFLNAVFLFFSALILAVIEKKQHGYQLADLGLGNSYKDNLKAAVIPVLAIGPWLMLFNVLAWFFQVPLLLPRPFELKIYLDFLILLGILLLFNFSVEFLFRGLYQTKIQKATDRPRLVITVKSGFMSGTCLGTGFSTVALIKFSGLLLELPIIFIPVLYGICIAFFVFLGMLSAIIYSKIGNIIGSTVFMSLFMTLIVAGKLLLAYA